MTNTSTRSRTMAAVLALAGTLALVAVVAVPAWAQGPAPATLGAAGWDCFQTPPFVVPPRIVCANSGLGRPIPGDPDPPPSYNLLTFDLGGTFLGTVHLIRADLYAGQPCPQSGEPYVFRAAIGYYECLRV
ncbi:MAG TPA: hypothetical protein VI503_02930 [Gaiellaceae bacterium]|nr:hypothetical protein [Gaiellaceae bacterium]